jgi:hypothetical protein
MIYVSDTTLERAKQPSETVTYHTTDCSQVRDSYETRGDDWPNRHWVRATTKECAYCADTDEITTFDSSKLDEPTVDAWLSNKTIHLNPDCSASDMLRIQLPKQNLDDDRVCSYCHRGITQ